MKTFNKELWLKYAQKQIEEKILSEKEVLDALNGWVSSFCGKTKQELLEYENLIKDKWFC